MEVSSGEGGEGGAIGEVGTIHMKAVLNAVVIGEGRDQ